MISEHEKFMRIALLEAQNAEAGGDVPIGAIIVKDNEIIGRGYNQVERLGDATAHAEMQAINEAVKKLNYKHLLDCAIYVTLEPCSMCAGAIVLARIPILVYGADDSKSGASCSLYNITSDKRLNHRCKVIPGILKDESAVMIKNFFNELRKKK